jgi:hypothetical protein
MEKAQRPPFFFLHKSMSETTQSVPPFFECKLQPPPILPLLTSQTDVSYYLSHPTRLSAQESLYFAPQKSAAMRTSCTRYSPYLGKSSKRSVKFTPHYTSSSDSERSSPDPHDRRSAERETSLEKIEKPQGEAGRPNAGGYNLEAKVGWEKKEFMQLRVSQPSFPLAMLSWLYSGICPFAHRRTPRRNSNVQAPKSLAT